MFDSKRIRCAAIGLAFLGASLAPLAEAAEVSVVATEATVTMTNGIVNAQFRIAATNLEEADATNVVVTFPSGPQVVVGDVAAGATVASAPETLTYDASGKPTKYQALPVTVTFTVGGQVVEQAGVIHLAVQD